jgi:hypothetical protein
VSLFRTTSGKPPNPVTGSGEQDQLPPMPRFVSDEHDARYEFSVPRTTYEDLRDEYVDLRKVAERLAPSETWNAAMERAAEIADYYAELMNSEAARRIAEQIRCTKLPLPSPGATGKCPRPREWPKAPE